MPTPDPARTLKALGACRDARAAARPFGTPQMAYLHCRRGDHLAWYFGRLAQGTDWGSPEHRRAALVSVICARYALPHVPEPHRGQIDEILAQIEGWARGTASLTQTDLLALRQRTLEIRSTLWRAYAAAAEYAADAYAYAAAEYAAEYAAAAYAAYAAAAAAADDAAAYAAAASDADASDAAYWSARQVARETALRDLARLIRAEFPRCPLPGGLS